MPLASSQSSLRAAAAIPAASSTSPPWAHNSTGVPGPCAATKAGRCTSMIASMSDADVVAAPEVENTPSVRLTRWGRSRASSSVDGAAAAKTGGKATLTIRPPRAGAAVPQNEERARRRSLIPRFPDATRTGARTRTSRPRRTRARPRGCSAIDRRGAPPVDRPVARRWRRCCRAIVGAMTVTCAPVDTLLALVVRRLEVAETVAAAKWSSGRPVEDRAREAAVVAAAAARARRAGIDATFVCRVMAAQIEASKIVQRALLTRWRDDPGSAPTSRPDLSAVRSTLDAIDEGLVGALAAPGLPGSCFTCGTRLGTTWLRARALPDVA